MYKVLWSLQIRNRVFSLYQSVPFCSALLQLPLRQLSCQMHTSEEGIGITNCRTTDTIDSMPSKTGIAYSALAKRNLNLTVN